MPAKRLAQSASPSSAGVFTFDFQTEEENWFSHSEIDYSSAHPTDSCFPDDLGMSSYGVIGSPEAYYKWPYSAICTMFVTFDTNNDGTGDSRFVSTATMVGPDVALTAEECTYSSLYGYPKEIVLMPGMYTSGSGALVKPFGEARPLSLSRGNFESTHNPNDNWAILYLDSRIGDTTGWFGVSDSGIAENDNVYVMGQSSSNDFSNSYGYGNVKNLQTYSFLYDPYPSAKPTMVGSAVRGENRDTLHGIHTSGTSAVAGKTYSQACKVSIYIEGWLQDRGGQVQVGLHSRPGEGSVGDQGHAFLVVENLFSDRTIKAGRMILSPGEAVSLGTWNGKDHKGLYYNLEYLTSKQKPLEFSSVVSITKKIFWQQWQEANETVLNGDHWSLFDNCSSFALRVWNAARPSDAFDIFGVATPQAIIEKIMESNSYQIGRTICGSSRCGYYKGDGTFMPYGR